MHIGLIGLGKMGFNLGLNLLDNNFDVVAFDVNEEARAKFAESRISCWFFERIGRTIAKP